jgi:hypothetical protein
MVNGLAGGDGMGMANGGMVMRARGDAVPIYYYAAAARAD